MNEVSLRSSIAHSPESVSSSLASELLALQDTAGGLKLSVDLSDLQMPLEGEILVSVRPNFAKINDRTFTVELSASAREKLYPKFAGRLTLCPAPAKKSELLLEGNIEIPLGVFGRSMNATLFSGAARKSLERFLDRLARDVDRRVKREEEQYAQSVQRSRTP